MREYLRNNKDLAEKSKDSAWLEAQISSNPMLPDSTAYSLVLQEFREERTRIGCLLKLTYDEETGVVSTEVGLIAPEELMNSWYPRWSPAFGETICQKY